MIKVTLTLNYELNSTDFAIKFDSPHVKQGKHLNENFRSNQNKTRKPPGTTSEQNKKPSPL